MEFFSKLFEDSADNTKEVVGEKIDGCCGGNCGS